MNFWNEKAMIFKIKMMVKGKKMAIIGALWGIFFILPAIFGTNLE